MDTILEAFQISVREVILTSRIERSGALRLYLDDQPLAELEPKLLINLPTGSETVIIRIRPPDGGWSLDVSHEAGEGEAEAWEDCDVTRGRKSTWRRTAEPRPIKITAKGRGPSASLLLFNKVTQPIDKPIDELTSPRKRS